MKKLIFLLFAFSCIYSHAQKDKTGAQMVAINLKAQLLRKKHQHRPGAQMVAINLKAQQDAWNNGDIKGFMAYYWNSDSLRFVSSRGIDYGWQSVLDNYVKNYPDKAAMGTLSFTIEETFQLSPVSVFVTGIWALEKEKPARGYFTLLWKKKKGQWVIVVDHTS